MKIIKNVKEVQEKLLFKEGDVVRRKHNSNLGMGLNESKFIVTGTDMLFNSTYYVFSYINPPDGRIIIEKSFAETNYELDEYEKKTKAFREGLIEALNDS